MAGVSFYLGDVQLLDQEWTGWLNFCLMGLYNLLILRKVIIIRLIVRALRKTMGHCGGLKEENGLVC